VAGRTPHPDQRGVGKAVARLDELWRRSGRTAHRGRPRRRGLRPGQPSWERSGVGRRSWALGWTWSRCGSSTTKPNGASMPCPRQWRCSVTASRCTTRSTGAWPWSGCDCARGRRGVFASARCPRSTAPCGSRCSAARNEILHAASLAELEAGLGGIRAKDRGGRDRRGRRGGPKASAAPLGPTGPRQSEQTHPERRPRLFELVGTRRRCRAGA